MSSINTENPLPEASQPPISEIVCNRMKKTMWALAGPSIFFTICLLALAVEFRGDSITYSPLHLLLLSPLAILFVLSLSCLVGKVFYLKNEYLILVTNLAIGSGIASLISFICGAEVVARLIYLVDVIVWGVGAVLVRKPILNWLCFPRHFVPPVVSGYAWILQKRNRTSIVEFFERRPRHPVPEKAVDTVWTLREMLLQVANSVDAFLSMLEADGDEIFAVPVTGVEIESFPLCLNAGMVLVVDDEELFSNPNKKIRIRLVGENLLIEYAAISNVSSADSF